MGESKIDLMQGTLDLLILQCLSRAPRLHGYAIVELIAERSSEAFQVEEGALYPALHRLELKGWLDAEWGVSENNRRAKYYRLTPRGRKQLELEKAEWQRLTFAMARVLELA